MANSAVPIKPDTGTDSMLQSIPPSESARTNYVGRDVFTADNHWIGFVREMREHPRDGAMVLIVHNERFDHQTICVKVNEIGVVTRARVMLDVGFSLFERERDSRYRCPPEFLAA